MYYEGIGGAPIDLNDLQGWWPLNGNMNDYSGNSDPGLSSSDINFRSQWWTSTGYQTP